MTLAQVAVSAQQKLAASICTTSTTYCNGTNTDSKDLYTSIDQCQRYLTKDVRLGEAYELGTLHCQEHFLCDGGSWLTVF